MSEGMALALPSLHEGFLQGTDHPGLPHPFGRASSLKGLAAPQISRCLLTVGRSPSSRFPGQWLCWLVPRVYREPLTPDGRKGLPVCSPASVPPCIACIISTQRATLPQSQLRDFSAKEGLGGRSLLAVLHGVGGRGVSLSVLCSACGETGPHKVPEAAAVRSG